MKTMQNKPVVSSAKGIQYHVVYNTCKRSPSYPYGWEGKTKVRCTALTDRLPIAVTTGKAAQSNKTNPRD